MSKPRYSTIPAGALTDDRLNMTDIRVLGMLGTFNWNKGWCFPLQDTIADALKRSRPVINASLARLEQCGYVESKKKKGGANRKLYRVVLDQKDDSPDIPDGMFEAEGDVGPTNISKSKPKPRDVRPVDMSAQSTCLPDKHVSEEMSAGQTTDVGPADIQRELAKPNKQKEERAARATLTHLPEDWDPRDEEVRIAESLNFTREQFNDCLKDFRVYWHGEAARKTKASRKADWNLTFRDRLRTVAGWWKTTHQKPSKLLKTSVKSAADWTTIMRDWLDNKGWPKDLGVAPDHRDYGGPYAPLEPLLADRPADHPFIAKLLAKVAIAKQRAAS